jgi:integrase
MGKLTVVKVRNAKTKKKAYKLPDGKGLYLHVAPTGRKSWRYRYKIDGWESTFTIGSYPKIGLEQARKERMEARELVKAGKNPAKARKEKKKARIQKERLAAENAFGTIAIEWWENNKDGWSKGHADQVLGSLKADVYPFLGDLPVDTITPVMIHKMIKKVEDRGALEVAKKVLQRTTAIFRYAIQTGRATHNPAREMQGALKGRKVCHHKALTRRELPQFLRTLTAANLHITTKLALRFLILTATRSGEVRGATWDEIDLKEKIWIIPEERMKMNTPHRVPLSRQAIEILVRVGRLYGQNGLVFPGIRQDSDHLSQNTLLYAIYRLGYRGRATAHGFRATFSTIANESGWDADVIEKALAHEERNRVRAAYHRSEYLVQRSKLMQWWADTLGQIEHTD